MVIADLETIDEILRDRPDGFRRWSELDAITQETGFTGVFAAEGEAWRSRRLVVTALNSNHLQRYFHRAHGDVAPVRPPARGRADRPRARHHR